MNDTNRAVVGTLSLVGLVVGILTGGILGYKAWRIQQDIYGWMYLAQISNEPHDMYTYLSNVKSGMEAWGMTSGNSALFFPDPSTDMGKLYRAIGQDIDQSRYLESFDKGSPQYAINLDNLRGAIREQTIPAYQYFANHDGLVVSIFCWIGWIVFLILGLIWLLTV